MSRPAIATLALATLLGTAAPAIAEGTQPYARIMVEATVLRAGPGRSFRRIHLAHRGEVFAIVRRSTQGYWFQVELPDGTRAWVMGDAVYVHEVSEEEAAGGRRWPKLFAPPSLPDAKAELAVTFGALGRGGFMAVRPTWLVRPVFGIEVNAAASVSRGGRVLLAGLGGIVNLFPDSPVVPFFVAGGGYATSNPNADTFLLESGSIGVAYAGGGLRFGFRYRLTLRIEARAYAFIEPNRYVAQEEYSGGLTVFF
ncbi:MAG: SH3 domain-containing protein [Myxococcota bacterium]